MEVPMDIVVNVRHGEVSERFRDHVQDKLSRLEKHDHKVIRIEVEVEKERNPRLQDRAMRVQLTAFTKGPIVRAEAAADDKMAALDMALDKMSAQMRKAADRKRVHRGRHSPVSVAQATAQLDGQLMLDQRLNGVVVDDQDMAASLEVDGDGPLVVREKSHPARPMTLDQALYEMELVGHDFFLFLDHVTRQPAVVYRRRGYDYGVIRLELEGESAT
jgi:ribosomal subunit interface protein